MNLLESNLDSNIIEKCKKLLNKRNKLSEYDIRHLLNIGEYNPDKITTLLYIYHNYNISDQGKEYFLSHIYNLIPQNSTSNYN